MAPKPTVDLFTPETPWDQDELRALATVRGSIHHKALSKAFTMLRDRDREVLFDPATPPDRTQYVRGRLSLLADLVLLLEQEAPRRYEEARSTDAKRDAPE